MIDRALLSRLAAISPHQPATCLFRAVELGHVIRSGWIPRTGRMLDVGCGDGRVTQLLREGIQADWKLVGVDPDPEEASLARATGLYERVVVSSTTDLDEPAGTFDAAISNSVLEHVLDIEGLLGAVGRLLRPGGTFVFSVPSARFPAMLGGPGLLGYAATGARDRASYQKALDERLVHLRYWTVEEWRQALARAGLSIRRSSYYMTAAELRRWESLANATGGLLARVARGRVRPIDVQRRFGWRRVEPPTWLRPLASALVLSCAVGVPKADSPLADGAGLLVEAAK